MSKSPIQIIFDEFTDTHPLFSKGIYQLRSILLDSGLEETVKWGKPVYTFMGKNLVGLAAFKAHFGLWFFQGSFLKDPEKILINAQEGKTKGQRQIRFTSPDQINEVTIRTYVQEAIANQKQGKTIRITPKIQAIPEELLEALNKDPELKTSFDNLTPGRQKEYAEYLAEAKRSETRLKRLEKIIPMIRSGIGLNDKYR